MTGLGKKACHCSARLAAKGDWLRGAIRCRVEKSAAATVPVPFRLPLRGVTAVELVAVILILGIVAAVAVPRYTDNLMQARVDAAARRIVADLTAAQARAKAASSSQTVTFVVPPRGSRYEIVGMKDPDRPGESYVVNLDASPYQVAFGSVNLGGGTTLVYNGYGVPDRSGTLVVQAGKSVRTVTIDSSTGMASFQ